VNNTQTKNQLILAGILLSIVLGIIIYAIIKFKTRNQLLKTSSTKTYAIIIDKYVGAKRVDYVKFKFTKNGITYLGHQKYRPDLESVNEGDTCEMIYVTKDPKIYRLLEDEDHLLKIKRQNIIFNDLILN